MRLFGAETNQCAALYLCTQSSPNDDDYWTPVSLPFPNREPTSQHYPGFSEQCFATSQLWFVIPEHDPWTWSLPERMRKSARGVGSSCLSSQTATAVSSVVHQFQALRPSPPQMLLVNARRHYIPQVTILHVIFPSAPTCPNHQLSKTSFPLEVWNGYELAWPLLLPRWRVATFIVGPSW